MVSGQVRSEWTKERFRKLSLAFGSNARKVALDIRFREFRRSSIKRGAGSASRDTETVTRTAPPNCLGGKVRNLKEAKPCRKLLQG